MMCLQFGFVCCKVDSNPSTMNGYLKDETEELGPSPYTRAYPATYPAPAPPPTGTPRRSRTAGSTRRGVKLQRVCQKANGDDWHYQVFLALPP